MIEIKFRQLWECQNGHKRWAHFRFPTVKDQLENISDELHFTWGLRTCDCPTHELGEGYHPVNEQQQYTGLKDKNGVEIYEGDLLIIHFGDPDINGRFMHSGIEVFWSEEHLQFRVRGGNIADRQEVKLTGYHLGEYEVIGNIYENPELLKNI